MRLRCKINQAESTRRGVDSDPFSAITIDPEHLPEDQRLILSACIMGENFKTPQHVFPILPEASEKGLREVLGQLAADDGSSCRRQFDSEKPSVCVDGELEAGGMVITEVEPHSPWPPGIYCVWRIESVVGNRYANTVLDLAASKKYGDTMMEALRLKDHAT
jgi:hypothetical protein